MSFPWMLLVMLDALLANQMNEILKYSFLFLQKFIKLSLDVASLVWQLIFGDGNSSETLFRIFELGRKCSLCCHERCLNFHIFIHFIVFGSTIQVSLDVQLCQSGLTKVVTFSPFYMVSNVSNFDMEVKEFGKDEWTFVKAETVWLFHCFFLLFFDHQRFSLLSLVIFLYKLQCVGLWPRQEQKRKYLVVRYAGTVEESIMFPFTENFEQFCFINNAVITFPIAT